MRINTEALRGALSKGGKCIAVMPGGLSEIYPKSNEAIANKITVLAMNFVFDERKCVDCYTK